MLRGRDHFILTAALVSLLFSVSLHAQSAPRIEPADVQRLAGVPWKGSLTYLDYRERLAQEELVVAHPVEVAGALVRRDAERFN